ncbi:hypothetical protein ACGRHY_14450 [Streptomyces sp. HK10]|uniref:hypothetical protein n=1 Tax=Streptomyces sp. HK10 TaxID=3373255 RepID=UPI0037494BC4
MAAFDARKAVEELSEEPFEFIGLDGRTYRLPNAQTVSGHQANRIRTGDETVLKEIADPDAYHAIMEMPTTVGADLARAWIRHSGRVGKEPSPSSRPRKRRKR